MALALKQEEYTVEDIFNLPEGQRAELIDGQIYMMGAPSLVHQWLVLRIGSMILSYIDAHGGPCKVNIAPVSVFLNADDKTYVEPDIFVVCDPKKLADNVCNGAPDWIIEIVSPGSRRMDYKIKRMKYLSSGVKEYWIIDPESELIQVWDFSGDTNTNYTFDQMVPVGIYDDFYIDFSKINI